MQIHNNKPGQAISPLVDILFSLPVELFQCSWR